MKKRVKKVNLLIFLAILFLGIFVRSYRLEFETIYNPLDSSWTMVFYSSLTIVLIFFIIRNFFGEKIAQITTAFFALSPLMIKYNESTLNFCLVPLFEIILLGTVLWFLSSQRTFAPILAGLSSAFLIQLHYSNLPVLLFIFLIFLSVRFGSNLSTFLFGFFLGFFSFSDFGIQLNFFETNQTLNFITHFIKTKKIISFSNFAEFSLFFNLLFGNNSILTIVSLIFLLIGLIYSFQRGKLYRTIALVFLFSLTFFIFIPIRLSSHDFISQPLLIFIIIAIGIISMLPKLSFLILVIICFALISAFKLNGG